MTGPCPGTMDKSMDGTDGLSHYWRPDEIRENKSCKIGFKYSKKRDLGKGGSPFVV